MSYKVGDIVIIDHKVNSWPGDSWVPEMDKFIGERAVIVSTSVYSRDINFICRLVEGGQSFNFPSSCFKLPLKQKEDKFKVKDIVTHKDFPDFFQINEVSSNKILMTNLKDGSISESSTPFVKLFYRYFS